MDIYNYKLTKNSDWWEIRFGIKNNIYNNIINELNKQGNPNIKNKNIINSQICFYVTQNKLEQIKQELSDLGYYYATSKYVSKYKNKDDLIIFKMKIYFYKKNKEINLTNNFPKYNFIHPRDIKINNNKIKSEIILMSRFLNIYETKESKFIDKIGRVVDIAVIVEDQENGQQMHQIMLNYVVGSETIIKDEITLFKNKKVGESFKIEDNRNQNYIRIFNKIKNKIIYKDMSFTITIIAIKNQRYFDNLSKIFENKEVVRFFKSKDKLEKFIFLVTQWKEFLKLNRKWYKEFSNWFQEMEFYKLPDAIQEELDIDQLKLLDEHFRTNDKEILSLAKKHESLLYDSVIEKFIHEVELDDNLKNRLLKWMNSNMKILELFTPESVEKQNHYNQALKNILGVLAIYQKMGINVIDSISAFFDFELKSVF
ncbi:hypothetical protein EI74_0847 [Mycoplasma testudineum]|uniref:Uncharacterized protein n=1 Tax=Mycoplasma testudineum TaxID=244584 RepID=A0A4R6IBJ7_9MOLU|nr:hypothetical protein [Mycoplasma testudineum]OYD26473.1 hypothetical protein CG473_03735 [Mycoplasma testudineum]TDO18966.1 hypothetical protein EI74_0847 [Mycoplasma testudineum]